MASRPVYAGYPTRIMVVAWMGHNGRPWREAIYAMYPNAAVRRPTTQELVDYCADYLPGMWEDVIRAWREWYYRVDMVAGVRPRNLGREFQQM